jgi:hypothetical protein
MPAMNTTSSGSQAKAINITKGALVVMLLYALNDDNSYGYYQLLRWALLEPLATLSMTQ